MSIKRAADHHEEMAVIVIAGEVHSSKNSRQIFRNRKTNRPFVVKSKASKADEMMMSVQLIQQRPTWQRMTEGLSYPLYVEFRFIRRTKAHWDFSNLIQGVADAMKKADYIPDDSVDYFIPVYVEHEINKNAPGVEISIKKG